MSLERPNWNDIADRALYDELWNKDPSERSEQEERFLKSMYHQEEYACGLDG